MTQSLQHDNYLHHDTRLCRDMINASTPGPRQGASLKSKPRTRSRFCLLALAAVMIMVSTAVVVPSLFGRSALLPAVVLEQVVGTAVAAKERAFIEIERSRGLPVRGQSRASVERQFGAPGSSRPAVGQPPISSWKYPEFVVYFEYNHVITTVANKDHLPVRLGDIQ